MVGGRVPPRAHDLRLGRRFLPDSVLKSGFDEAPPPFTRPQFLNQLNLDISLGNAPKVFPALAFYHVDQKISAASGQGNVGTADSTGRGGWKSHSRRVMVFRRKSWMYLGMTQNSWPTESQRSSVLGEAET